MGLLNKLGLKKKERLEEGLEKSRTGLLGKLGKALVGKDKIDEEVLDDLEEVLITSDVGVKTTLEVIKRIEQRVARDKFVYTSELNKILKEEIISLLREHRPEQPAEF
ncbi:MAG TPA: signal recognition particle receptor subunit alpha, partial [Balneolales bacterium]|nr:signal recognition particle receptor subunit alpha [Balneolales bacterium]